MAIVTAKEVRDARTAKTVEKLKPKQVCILGTAETMVDAPFDDKEWDMWSVASVLGNHGLKRIDRLIELHDKDSWGPRIGEINESGARVWMKKHYDEIPLSVEFPIDAILEKFRRYFTNSVSYLIALAIMEGYTDIGLFGVHMATATEYASQRPSCEYFIGYAEARGINIWIPDGADILKAARLYGYEQVGDLEKKVNKLQADMTNRMNDYSRAELMQRSMKDQAMGWVEATKHLKQLIAQ
jgi:hypothetical protein